MNNLNDLMCNQVQVSAVSDQKEHTLQEASSIFQVLTLNSAGVNMCLKITVVGIISFLSSCPPR